MKRRRPIAEYAQALIRTLGNRPQKLLFEPGRLLIGNAGVLLDRSAVPETRRRTRISPSSMPQ